MADNEVAPETVGATGEASDAKAAEGKPGAHSPPPLTPLKIALLVLGALVSLYVFLVGLTLMGTAFKILGGKGASSLFTAVSNPIAGLTSGVLATVLVQSSSTSTAIVVTLVGEGSIAPRVAIPMIMGANIGTSVTNTIVSMGSVGDRLELERAFAGATVHDVFNLLSVLTMLPLEAIIAGISGEGGPLYFISKGLTEVFIENEAQGGKMASPLKMITAPIADGILKSNKAVITAGALAPPVEKVATSTNNTLCVNDGVDCSKYTCLTKDMDKQFKKASSSSYKKLTKCSDYIIDNTCSSKGKCYLDGMSFYNKKIKNGKLVKGGIIGEIPNEVVAGIIGLILSILILCIGLAGLTKSLKTVFLSNTQAMIKCALATNDYLAILIGVIVTILVQSSSVTTSSLTPLCGLGVLPLAKMLPLTLGANIGTTMTAFIAALASLKFPAVQIAICHLLFNLIGILVWFPAPPMRNVVLSAAKSLGLYASFFRWIPLAYIIVVFFVLPGVALGISAAYEAGGGFIALGIILTLLVLGGIGGLAWVWNKGIPGKNEPLCYKVITQEQRDEAWRELEAANAVLAGAAAPAAPADQDPASVNVAV